MLVDTHAHLNDEKFNEDRAEVIKRAKEVGVETIINIGYNRETILSTIELVEQYDFIFGAVGWHPNDAHEMKEEDFDWLKEITQHPKILAIGEIGLDYYWDFAPKEVQQEIFRKQIQLAKQVNLPIIIHDRDAHQDICSILREEGAKDVGGIIHSFSGSMEMAKECIDLGFYISFSGPVTFKNAKKPKEVATHIPIDRILLETDSPYLTPEPYRGKRNESAYVKFVATKIAELRGMDVEEIAQITTRNAKRILKF
ncbi:MULTISPECIES: TatD family hydrolase [Tepidibacillus]|uniref:Hydrolase TatD n=1 Tax=Tepidibacillus decaturensis TaxID=1413211 RepID=A0A135L761_9BACI|nr:MULTISPECIES: TatD family hydrolase [Tepidibacillus]KXG44828.1 hydrolase TatD [Tepidibacillus decaturensis]GBF11413.1 putative deoxyribonuclease YcfH [Tepidibacillus sp. HK-1]